MAFNIKKFFYMYKAMSFCCGKFSCVLQDEISSLSTMMLTYLYSFLCLVGFAEAGYQYRRQSGNGNGTTSLDSTESGSPCAIVSQSAAAALASAATGMLPPLD
jgi:hypothetical protein